MGNRPTDEKIKEMFMQIAVEEGQNKSTSYLVQITANRLDLHYMEVIDALFNIPKEERPYE